MNPGMHNIQVFIVIAVLLLGLVIRRAGVRKPPHAPMPPFGGEGQARRTKPVGRGATEESQPDRSFASGKTFAEPRLIDALAEKARPSRSMSTRSSVHPAYELDAAGTASSPLSHPSREEVIRGILWAEVLGPPRAKRPYKPR